MDRELVTRYLDFTGGLQTATSRLLQADNELSKVTNGRYGEKVGGITRRYGYEQVGDTVAHGNDILGISGFVRDNGKYNLLEACDNSTDTYSELRYLDLYESRWTAIDTTGPASAKYSFESLLNYQFVVGYAEGLNSYVQTYSINDSMTKSTTDNVYNAPRGKYIAKYKDKIYIAGAWVAGKAYPTRVYLSSAPTDAITYVNGAVKKSGALELQVDSVRYLKAGMSIDIYKENSNVVRNSNITIVSVNKDTDKITFAATNIDLSDRDEIYKSGEKGTLKVFWNTDYPNPDSSDFIDIPPIQGEMPGITGMKVHNNRLFIFTENSVRKWDGANLTMVTDKVGCVAPRSVDESNGWLIFLHHTGLWGYNDRNGQMQLLSRGIKNYIDAITSNGKKNAVGIAKDDEYRLYVGQLAEIDDRTTSTSTSSTSTSSTSSSTSSTSTSSTSTSSTSTSRSNTTSTSSTSKSSSTSSTSSSTSSTSTSSTSTSTTTVEDTTEYSCLVYNFAQNNWAVDTTNRRVTCATIYEMYGYDKVYVGDNTGRVFRADTTLNDHGRPIQLIIETKRFHLEKPETTKKFRRAYIYSQNGQNAIAYYSIDGGQWKSIGQLSSNVTPIEIGDIEGRDIAFRIAQNNNGEPVIFIGVSIVWIEGKLELNAT